MDNDPLVSIKNIKVLGAKTRDKQFLQLLGEMLESDWLKNQKSKVKNNTLLIALACKCVDVNDFVSLQELLVKVNINTLDYEGSTLIHRACENGKMDMLKYLLSKGSNHNIPDRLGNTPMTIAVRKRHLNIVKLLRKFGGAVQMQSVRIGMELCKAVQSRDYVMLLLWYLAGVDMDQGNYDGKTAMHTAVRNRDACTVSQLLNYGATPLVRDVWGVTAVDEAKKHHLTDILMMFHPRFTKSITDKQS